MSSENELDATVKNIDEEALGVEGQALLVDEDGVLRKGWHGHLPVSGKIAETNKLSDILDGALFWDPAASSVVVVMKDGSHIVVKQGTVDLDEEFAEGSKEDQLAAAARRRIETAYDEDRCLVSGKLVDLSVDGLMTLLEPYGTNAILVDQARRVGRDVKTVWKILAELGVMERGK